ncbi:hypothetical protein Tco_0998464 [Tanacetum coccineum]
MNINRTSEPTTPTNVHAEENNDNQAEFTNPFCTPALENAKSSSRNIEHPSDTYVLTMKMEILLEPASNKLLVDGEMVMHFPLESNHYHHAHAQTTKTYYKHQDSRIMKAQELKTKTSTQTLIYKIFLQRYQVYQGRLLASFQGLIQKIEACWSRHKIARWQRRSRQTRKRFKDLETKRQSQKTMTSHKDQRSQSMKEQLQRIQRPRPQDLNDKSNLIDLMKECHNELTSGEIVSLKNIESNKEVRPERDRVVADLSQAEKDRLRADIRSELTKDDHESQLYDEFEHFGQHKGENINDYYVRFMTAVKLNKGLKESNHDQLYAYLKKQELHDNENKMLMERLNQHSHDPLALVSNVSSYQYPSSSSTPPQPSYIPPVTYQPQFTDNTQLDTGFSPADELLDNLTKQVALLAQQYKTQFPQTNNQLRTSSNIRNQATVQNGRVVVQNVQGRQNRVQGNNARGAAAAGNGGA